VENLYGYYMVLRDPPTKSLMLSAHILVFRMRDFAQYLEAILQPPNMNIDDQPSISAQYQGGNQDRMSSITTIKP